MKLAVFVKLDHYGNSQGIVFTKNEQTIKHLMERSHGHRMDKNREYDSFNYAGTHDIPKSFLEIFDVRSGEFEIGSSCLR